MKITSNGRWPPIKDDLKIIKVEYLNNHLLDHTHILNLNFDDQTLFYKFLKWRRPPMEDDLKILKVKNLSNPLLDHTQILNLSLDDQTILYKLRLRWPKQSVQIL